MTNYRPVRDPHSQNRCLRNSLEAVVCLLQACTICARTFVHVQFHIHEHTCAYTYTYKNDDRCEVGKSSTHYILSSSDTVCWTSLFMTVDVVNLYNQFVIGMMSRWLWGQRTAGYSTVLLMCAVRHQACVACDCICTCVVISLSEISGASISSMLPFASFLVGPAHQRRPLCRLL